MRLRLERFANADGHTPSQIDAFLDKGASAVSFRTPLASRPLKPPLEVQAPGSEAIIGHAAELTGKAPASTGSPTATRAPTGSSYGIANPQNRIFPGIVHDRHRRTSARQGSGSETDPESMAGSWISEGKKGPRSTDSTNALQESVLEEAAEDA